MLCEGQVLFAYLHVAAKKHRHVLSQSLEQLETHMKPLRAEKATNRF